MVGLHYYPAIMAGFEADVNWLESPLSRHFGSPRTSFTFSCRWAELPGSS